MHGCAGGAGGAAFQLPSAPPRSWQPCQVASAPACAFVSKPRPCWPLQEIKRESLNADNHSAFWHDRYTLRQAYDPVTGQPLTEALPQQPTSGAAAAAAASGGAQQLGSSSAAAGTLAAAGSAASSPGKPQQQAPPRHDVPVFLRRQKALILNTGKYLNVMRECQATPPRTLPLGTRLGEPAPLPALWDGRGTQQPAVPAAREC